ncbi:MULTISPECIES: hypothetical protein [Streptococcus anginosus group]|uniref:hypothetical protein n=1 Tax=Streptococcus anginosus group TaxID=671232 RepID=UPI0020011AD9|nr:MULTISPECIES: hypothetical protein [Streptococcus anginosus group]MCW1056179.1 hypothetical protein [Streptococcus anginosus]
MEKTGDKLNRIDILNFTNAVLSIADQFESVQTDLEENGLYSLIPTEYREEYFDLVEDFRRSSLVLIDKIIENNLLDVTPCQECSYSEVEI